MPFRYLWLAVSSDTVQVKAFNFLKLIKPPLGDELTDLNIKLDWNKDTALKWTVPDAKSSMLAKGYDWVKRDPGPPLSETNFKIVYETDQEPVTDFEEVEEWMGPALGPGDVYVVRDGVFYVEQPPGSAYDKWPIDGVGAVMNVDTWVTVVVQPPLSDSDYWFRTMVQKVKDTSAASSKVSLNGNGNSQWYEWTSVQDPELGVGETIALFKESAVGEPFPIRPRMAFA